MSEVNWDEVASDADHSPRAILTEYLAEADDIIEVVVVALKRDPTRRAPLFGYETSRSASGLFAAIGMLRITLEELEASCLQEADD